MSRYAYSFRLSFETLDRYRGSSLAVITVVLDQMILKVRTTMHRHEGIPEDITTRIRPFPTEVGESCKNGFDKLIPRLGIEIIVSADDRPPARIEPRREVFERFAK